MLRTAMLAALASACLHCLSALAVPSHLPLPIFTAFLLIPNTLPPQIADDMRNWLYIGFLLLYMNRTLSIVASQGARVQQKQAGCRQQQAHWKEEGAVVNKDKQRQGMWTEVVAAEAVQQASNRPPHSEQSQATPSGTLTAPPGPPIGGRGVCGGQPLSGPRQHPSPHHLQLPLPVGVVEQHFHGQLIVDVHPVNPRLQVCGGDKGGVWG